MRELGGSRRISLVETIDAVPLDCSNIVHNANDNKSKGYDSIDMCMLKKSFRAS